jgi:hypothetical protein
MKCTENGCTVRMADCVAFIPSLSVVADLEGKTVVELTAEDLEKHALCDECARLHRQFAGTAMFRLEAAQSKLGREKVDAEKRERRLAWEAAEAERKNNLRRYGTTATVTIGDQIRLAREAGIQSAFANAESKTADAQHAAWRAEDSQKRLARFAS